MGPVVVSALARVEVVAALWRKQRIGELALDDAFVLVAAFEADWAEPDPHRAPFVAVQVTSAVLDRAAALVAHHGLRAYDGVQLASAVVAPEAVGGTVTFAAFDHGVCEAAAREGFAVLP